MNRKTTVAALFAIAGLTLGGCNAIREITGYTTLGDPSVSLKTAESRWLLVKNPRFGSIPSEPEYIWVEENKVPTTLRTIVLGKKSIIAPPEVVARYGPPPGGGRISPRQRVPYQVAAPDQPIARDARTASVSTPAALPSPRGPVDGVAPAPVTPRGYVVYIDTTRLVIDLTGQDGVRAGALVSVRRDKTPIVHPVTGELLGELDEEVATARVTEIREKFSVAEIEGLAPGSHIQVRDRVVLK
jgi:Flagellar assembly protein T, C-terminal domain